MEALAELSSARGRRRRGPRERMTPNARREALWGLAFLSPWIVGFLIWTLIPMVATIFFSLTDVTVTSVGNAQWVGLKNYAALFKDAQVWKSLIIVLRYGALALPVGLIVPLVLALMMNSKYLMGKSFFRTGFYFPYIIPFVAAIFIWGAMLNPDTGWINQFLRWAGVANPPFWLRDTTWVYPALVILGIWGIGNAMLINLASLQGVPTELYEAATLDGAGWWGRLLNVTLPLISPVIFYNLVLSIVGLFQYFQVPLVLNQGTGDPGGATMFYNLYLYKTFFTFQNMGYGATLAWLLFIIILAVTVVLFWSSKYWVYYASEGR